jgi:shikimate kinase
VKRHVILVGLPGSGKTTVGGLVAERLKAAFVDIDAVLVRREGKPITMIFAEKGEATFRNLERQEMDTALTGEPSIIASGGGWAAQPGAMEGAKARALVIYLRVRADTAASRAGSEGTRPLLMGGDGPAERMRQLLKEREASYALAHEKLDTDRKTAAQVAADVVRLAQTMAGW